MNTNVSGVEGPSKKGLPLKWMAAAVAVVIGAILFAVTSCTPQGERTTVTKTQVNPPASPASQIQPPASVPSAPVPGVIKEEKETVVTGTGMCVSEQRMKELLAEACKAPSQTARSTVSKPRTVSKAPRRDTGGSSATATAAASGGRATATASGGGASATASVNAPSTPSVATAPSAVQPAPVPSSGPQVIWLWHAHDATKDNPKPCVIASGNGAGLPPYCSSHSVVAPTAGETKHQWLLRVGGGKNPTDTGHYQKIGEQPSR